MISTTVMPRALVVDDDPASSDILAQLLRYAGIAADIAVDGESAIELVSRADYQFIVIDLRLPSMDGWELLKTLRADARLSAVPMFSLTAYHDPVLAAKAHKAGFAACYPKPATPSIIHDIQALLRDTPRARGLFWGWDAPWR